MDLPRSESRVADKRNRHSFNILTNERAVKMGFIRTRPSDLPEMPDIITRPASANGSP